MAVIDAFYFLNELDVLEARLNILAPYVDMFVLVESPVTFSGVPKPLHFQENKERFKEFNIKHFIAQPDMFYDMARQSPNTGAGEHYWVEEFAQKESLQNALKNIGDNDIVYISDVDEIWRPRAILEFTDAVYKPRQLPYMYYFNQRTDEDWLGWTGTIATKYKNIKDGCINHLRTDSMTEYEVVENGGWHFNSIGGKEKKRSEFQHPVYQNDSEWKRREVNMRVDDSDLPEYLLDNKKLYSQYFL